MPTPAGSRTAMLWLRIVPVLIIMVTLWLTVAANRRHADTMIYLMQLSKLGELRESIRNLSPLNWHPAYQPGVTVEAANLRWQQLYDHYRAEVEDELDDTDWAALHLHTALQQTDAAVREMNNRQPATVSASSAGDTGQPLAAFQQQHLQALTRADEAATALHEAHRNRSTPLAENPRILGVLATFASIVAMIAIGLALRRHDRLQPAVQ